MDPARDPGLGPLPGRHRAGLKKLLLAAAALAALLLGSYLLFVGGVAFKERRARLEGPAKAAAALARLKTLAAPLGYAPTTAVSESATYAGYPDYRAYADLEFTTTLGLDAFTARVAGAFPGLKARETYDAREVRRASKPEPGAYLWSFGDLAETESVDATYRDRAPKPSVHLRYRSARDDP